LSLTKCSIIFVYFLEAIGPEEYCESLYVSLENTVDDGQNYNVVSNQLPSDQQQPGNDQ